MLAAKEPEDPEFLKDGSFGTSEICLVEVSGFKPLTSLIVRKLSLELGAADPRFDLDAAIINRIFRSQRFASGFHPKN